MLFERLYGGIGKKSIGYFQKVLDFSQTAPYKRSVSSHPPLRYLRTSAPFPPIFRFVSFVQPHRHFLSSVPSPCNKRSVTSHPSPHFLRTNDSYSTISYPSISHSQLRYLRTSTPIPPIPCPIITHLPLRYFRINDPTPPIFRCNTT